MTTFLSLLSLRQQKKNRKNRILSICRRGYVSLRHANPEESFSRCVPRRSASLFFPPHARKVPVYYLNNGSRARVIVSPLFLSRRVTLLVTGERQREVEWGCSVSSRGRKPKRRMAGGVGRGSSSVPDSRYGKDRITTSQDEGCPPSPYVLTPFCSVPSGSSRSFLAFQ